MNKQEKKKVQTKYPSKLDSLNSKIVFYMRDIGEPITGYTLAELIDTSKQNIYNHLKDLREKEVVYKTDDGYLLHPLFYKQFDEVLDIFFDTMVEISSRLKEDEIDDYETAIRYNIIYFIKMIEVLERL